VTEKPLHVRVAEALGCSPVEFGLRPGTGGFWKCGCKDGFKHGQEYTDGYVSDNLKRYDTDWSATGPLIERYEIVVLRDIRSHAKTYCWMAVVGAQDDHGYLDKDYPDEGNGKSPLVAVCNLILALSKAGRL